MLGVLKVTLLFGTCAVVTSTFFDFKEFNPFAGESQTLANYSDVTVSVLSKNGRTIRYVEGSFTFQEQFDSSIQILYGLRKKDADGNFELIVRETINVCDFFDGFYKKNIHPLAETHNDFPKRDGSVCPIEARTYHIYEVDSFDQLDSDSDLSEGEYILFIIFLKDQSRIGGYEVQFYASD